METLQRTANRGSLATGYEIDNSLKLEDANFEHITKNYSGDGDMRTWTYSTWVKKCKFGSANFDYMYMFAGQNTSIHFLNNGILRVSLYNGSSTVYADIDRLFRDGSAWYHIIVALDTTQSTAADRVKIYINGVRETEFDNSTYTGMSQNEEFTIGQASANYQVGYFYAGGGSNYGFSGYMAETHYVNGTALDQDSFGEFDDDSGIWKPKEYTGSHGSKGFYLKFDDSSNLGKDSATSGIGDFSVSNITAADQATDTPTNNFCTFNPTFSWIYSGNDATSTILNGGTTADNIALSPGTAWKGAVGTMAVNKGKWYWEWENNGGAFGHRTHGILTTEFTVRSVYASDDYSNQLVFRDGGTPKIVTLIDGTVATPHLMTAYTSNNADVFGIALNMDDQEATFYRNGSAITIDGTSNTTIDISSVDGDTKYVYPLYSCYGSTEAHYNFGGYTAMGISSAASDANGYGTFEYAPPSGYYALCTKNLAEYG